MVDPISGKAVPVDQMGEHMRVQLLDPRWREQQQRFIDKQKETGFAEGGSIADNLKVFASKRGDIFGQAATGTGANSASAIAQQAALEKEQSELRSQVQWDGHQGSINSTQQRKQELVYKQPVAFATLSASSAAGSSSKLPVAGPAAAPPPGVPVLQSTTTGTSSTKMSGVPSATGMLLPPPPPPPPLQAPATTATTVVSSLVLPPPPPPPPLQAANAAGADTEPLAKRAKLELQQQQPSSFAPPPPPPVPSAGAQEVPVVPLVLVSAEEFAQRFSHSDGVVAVALRLPDTTSTPTAGASDAWGLRGQTLTVSVSVTASIKQFKEAAAAQLGGMPASKQQIRRCFVTSGSGGQAAAAGGGGGFLKDAATLAELNIGEGDTLELTVKSRGGRR